MSKERVAEITEGLDLGNLWEIRDGLIKLGATQGEIEELLGKLKEQYDELPQEEKEAYHVLAIAALLTNEPSRN